MTEKKLALWTSGDWNAFFGFGTTILVNMLVLTGLMLYVLKMPGELVFGRILPASGLMLFVSALYYAWLAYRLAKWTGRTDVCALPSGVSVPHMFIVVFVIMLPIALQTGDPVKGWEAGLTWVFVQSFVLMAGGFIGPIVRKITPRAALLGALAGVSISFISMRPAMEMFMTPVIGMLIGAQAFQETPKAHAPAIILALTPNLAAWGKLLIDNALGAAGTNAAAVGMDKLAQVGVLYQGLAIMGGGAIVAGVVLAAITASIIDRKLAKAAGFALAGAVLTFFGFMHGESLGIDRSPAVTISYLAVACLLLLCAKYAAAPAQQPAIDEGVPEPAK